MKEVDAVRKIKALHRMVDYVIREQVADQRVTPLRVVSREYELAG